MSWPLLSRPVSRKPSRASSRTQRCMSGQCATMAVPWLSKLLVTLPLRISLSSASSTPSPASRSRETSRPTRSRRISWVAGVAGFEPATYGFGDRRHLALVLPFRLVRALPRALHDLMDALVGQVRPVCDAAQGHALLVCLDDRCAELAIGLRAAA